VINRLILSRIALKALPWEVRVVDWLDALFNAEHFENLTQAV
jgi:hypothetical protein